MKTDTAQLRERLLAHLVQPVPESIALCEFACSASHCSPEEWRTCTRRLAALDGGGPQPIWAGSPAAETYPA
jgi:hypothetical protein